MRSRHETSFFAFLPTFRVRARLSRITADFGTPRISASCSISRSRASGNLSETVVMHTGGNTDRYMWQYLSQYRPISSFRLRQPQPIERCCTWRRVCRIVPSRDDLDRIKHVGPASGRKGPSGFEIIARGTVGPIEHVVRSGARDIESRPRYIAVEHAIFVTI